MKVFVYRELYPIPDEPFVEWQPPLRSGRAKGLWLFTIKLSPRRRLVARGGKIRK